MSREIEVLRKTLGEKILNFSEVGVRRIYFEVPAKDIKEVISYLFQNLGARFITVSGMEKEKGFDLIYHWAWDEKSKVISVRVKIDKDKPVVESISGIVKGAEFIEREIYELLGIEFQGHAQLKPLLGRENWKEGFYPLRRNK